MNLKPKSKNATPKKNQSSNAPKVATLYKQKIWIWNLTKSTLRPKNLTSARAKKDEHWNAKIKEHKVEKSRCLERYTPQSVWNKNNPRTWRSKPQVAWIWRPEVVGEPWIPTKSMNPKPENLKIHDPKPPTKSKLKFNARKCVKCKPPETHEPWNQKKSL